MKSTAFIITLISSLLYQSTFANHEHSILNLKLENNAPFTVELDGVHYPGNTSNFRAKDLPPGTHSIKVIRHHVNPHFPWLTAHSVIFTGMVVVAPSVDLYAMIDHHCNLVMYGEISLITPVVVEETCWWPSHCRAYHMHPAEFGAILDHIASKHDREDREERAKKYIKHHPFSVPQIREILLLFPKEKSRLKVVKKAWKHTCDRANFHYLFPLFHKEESIDKLLQHMYQEDN